MKNVKKLLAVLLAGLMLLSLAACGAKKDENVVKIGVIELSGMTDAMASEHKPHMKEAGDFSSDMSTELVNYNNLSSALMDLESGKITYVFIENSVANYIAAHNEKITVIEDTHTTDFSMMT